MFAIIVLYCIHAHQCEAQRVGTAAYETAEKCVDAAKRMDFGPGVVKVACANLEDVEAADLETYKVR